MIELIDSSIIIFRNFNILLSVMDGKTRTKISEEI